MSICSSGLTPEPGTTDGFGERPPVGERPSECRGDRRCGPPGEPSAARAEGESRPADWRFIRPIGLRPTAEPFIAMPMPFIPRSDCCSWIC